MGFFKDKRGVDCEPAENGVRRCRVFIATKNGKVAMGDDFSFGVDKNCQPVLVGRTSILKENEDLVNHTLNVAKTQCNKGIKEE